MYTFLFPVNPRMVDKEEVGGRLPSSGLKMVGGHRARLGTSFTIALDG
jgi:hypothetical protein